MPIRALVVDDETSLADLSMGLRMSGWSVTTANDGIIAVSTAGFRPDVFVLHVMMPDVDGIEALKKIRTFATRGRTGS